MRVLKLGVAVGSGLAVLMVLGAGWAPAAFTSDARIIATAQKVFPLLGLMLVRFQPFISSPRPQPPPPLITDLQNATSPLISVLMRHAT